MDDKLRKQVEGIGFELNGSTYDLNVETTGFMICKTDGWLKIWSAHIGRGGKCVEGIDEPTFEQILDAIKRHTGVDLKPKLTKRQEINELKEAVAELTKTVETLVDNQNSMNDDVARVHQIATYNKVKIDRMNMSPIENKPRFKVGECVCPHCNYDHVGFEHGADFMELPGIDQAYCAKCEGEFIIKLEYKITSLKIK